MHAYFPNFEMKNIQDKKVKFDVFGKQECVMCINKTCQGGFSVWRMKI